MRRLESNTSNLLKDINDNVERFNKDEKTGIYEYAQFTLSGMAYFMDSKGYLSKFNMASDEWIPCTRGSVKNSTYSSYGIQYNGMNLPISAHLLAMVALRDDFYEMYMSNANLVVNHKVSTIVSNGIGYTRTKVVKPNRSVDSNPLYLELVTVGQNNSHGRFVSNNNLSDVYVSAKDVNKLSKLIESNPLESAIDLVVDFYSKSSLSSYIRPVIASV